MRHLRSPERSKFGSERALFLTLKGEPVEYQILRNAFQRLRAIAGVKRTNSSYQPRLHDLRHTFAVHSIAQWGHDIQTRDRMLPILATYMGMLDMHGLNAYLELSPSTYQSQLDRLTGESVRVTIEVP
jgi:integrase/recombinase XerD